MFNPTQLLSRLLPCCASPSEGAETVKAVLDKANIGVLSAACCDATAAQKDEGLLDNLRQAMAHLNDQRAVVSVTITAAQQHLRALQSSADAQQQRLIGNVVSLFQANGLSIFPLLIVNGRVAYYGGVPSVEMIRTSLQKQPLTSLSA